MAERYNIAINDFRRLFNVDIYVFIKAPLSLYAYSVNYLLCSKVKNTSIIFLSRGLKHQDKEAKCFPQQ